MAGTGEDGNVGGAHLRPDAYDAPVRGHLLFLRHAAHARDVACVFESRIESRIESSG